MKLKILKQQIDQLFINGKADCPIIIRTKNNNILPLHIVNIKAGRELQEGEILLVVEEQLNIRLKDKNNQYYCSCCGNIVKEQDIYCSKCGGKIQNE